MHRWLVASLFVALCAGCSKTEQPAASAPPPSPSASAPPTQPLAGGGTQPVAIAPVIPAPTASAMRGQPSAKALTPPPPQARPERILPPTRTKEPSIERLALLPGGKTITREEIPAPPIVMPGHQVVTPSARVETTEPSAESPDSLESSSAVASRSAEARPIRASMTTSDPANALEPEVIMQEPPPARSSAPLATAEPSSMVSATQRQRRLNTLNELIIESIQSIPSGGEYRADANAISLLRQAVTISDRRLQIIPDLARPSFCSSATYLVFLTVMDRLHREQRVQLPEPALTALLIQGQPEGEGVWGRWNANGPGTARLFHELGLGRSFCDPATALPGDFLKIWWNEEIGSKERGHSVIYLGMEQTESGEMGVRYWSSNKPGGFGEAVAPMSKVKRMLFSRLETPRAVANAPRLPRIDRYLADMLKRRSTEDEMFQKCGLR
jgi:hypothetical protein